MAEVLFVVVLLLFVVSGVLSYASKSNASAGTTAEATTPRQTPAIPPSSVSGAEKESVQLRYLQIVRQELDRQLGLQAIVGRKLSFEEHWKDIEDMHLKHHPLPGDKNAYRNLTFWTEQFRERCRRIQEIGKKLNIDVDSIRKSNRVPAIPGEFEINFKRTRDSYRYVYWERDVTERVVERVNMKLADSRAGQSEW